MLDQLSDAGRQLRPASLLEALRERTTALHTEAERSGFVADMLRGRASLRGYTLMMRNLLPAYRTLEASLAEHAGSSVTGIVHRRELERAPSIEADLRHLWTGDAERDLPLLPSAVRYAETIARASKGDGAPLIAHAYARYLGDLSGGQILARLLRRSLDLPAGALSFYAFPLIADVAAFKAEYRAAIARAGDELGDFSVVVEEGARAFEANIALSVELQSAVAAGASR